MIRATAKSCFYTLSVGLVTLALLPAPDADKVDCDNVAHRYQAAVVGVVDALHSYEKCVASSDKRDDCAAQIQVLDNAHDDFADAVADAKACQ